MVKSGQGFSLEQLDGNGASTASISLSSTLDSVITATALNGANPSSDSGSAVAYVVGTKDGSPVLAYAAAGSGANSFDSANTSVGSLSAAEFETLSGIPLSQVVYIAPAGLGVIAVFDTGSGYSMKRLSSNLSVDRTEVALPFSYEPRSFRVDSYLNLYSSRDNGLDMVSTYDLNTVSTANLPDVGVAAQWTDGAYGEVIVADEDGDVAVVDLSNGAPEVSTFDLGAAATSLVYLESLDEVQSATGDASEIKRNNAATGEDLDAIELPGVPVAGSLRTGNWWETQTKSMVPVASDIYSYTTSFISRGEPWMNPTLNGASRGDTVSFSTAAYGTGVSNTVWEYSLDGGENWAERGQDWASAIPDIGSITYPPQDLPEPLDGVAPSLRQDATFTFKSSSFSRYEASVGMSDSDYDALWRYRVLSTYGSVVSGTTTINVDKPAEPVDLAISAQPQSARISAGEAHTFAVQATAAEGEISYQWERSTDGENWSSIDGETGAELHIVADLADQGTQYRVSVNAGDTSLTSDSATIEIMAVPDAILGAAPEGAVAIKSASYNLDLNDYSHEWLRRVGRGDVTIGADTGFTFSNGTGWTDPDTGETQISFNGTAVYLPYGGSFDLYFAVANPYLAVSEDGRATLTADIAWNDGSENWSGSVDNSFKRVIVATFADSEISSEGVFTGTPEWTGRNYEWPGLGDGNTYADGFPSSFLDFVASTNRGWFYSSGSFRDGEKAPNPVTISFEATTRDASTAGDTIDPLDPLGDSQYPFITAGPSDPSDPTDPIDPTDPSDPSDPSDPTDEPEDNSGKWILNFLSAIINLFSVVGNFVFSNVLGSIGKFGSS